MKLIVSFLNIKGSAKQEYGSIPGKKKRGRPKKIKNLDEQRTPESEKMDSSGNDVIKKRRGRPKKIHQQQKLTERDVKEREQLENQQQHHQLSQHHHHQQQQHYQQSPSILPHHLQQQHHSHQQQHHQLGHIGDGYGSVCFSPPLMSPPKPFAHMAPYSQQMGDPSGFFGQGK